jgi:redox-sensitive bicupin YhaK (pirin superfamily)
VFGLQAWVALPLAEEESAPSFDHYDADKLPKLYAENVQITVIAGEGFGKKSPARTLSPMVYADVAMQAGGDFEFGEVFEERALYVSMGAVRVNGEAVQAGRLAILTGGARITAEADARIALLGGPPLDAPRHVWWNFVASSREKLEAAKARWKAGGFDRVPGDDEFIPLPEN